MGFTAYAGSPVPCPLNAATSFSLSAGWCYGQYDEVSYLTNDSSIQYGYGGDSLDTTASFYVSGLAIGISPISNTLYGGDTAPFTAEASNAAGNSPVFSWTLVSGPGGISPTSGPTTTYTAPASITTSDTATIKGCITNLTTTPVCQTVSVDLVAVSITLDPPSPNVLLADGTSTSALSANLSDAPDDATVTWTPASQITSTGATTATYKAPASSSPLFTTSSNTASVSIVASVGTPAVTATTSLTLVQPTTITGVSPASWSAGSSGVKLTITGAGFSANSQVTVTNPNSWTTIYLPCTPTANPTTIICTLSVGANLSNVGSSQPVTVNVSTTTAGITSSATSAPITLAPIVYDYAITLQVTTNSLTYGSTSTITPHITCKLSTGAACPSGVYNPQAANFSITSGIGLATISNTTNATSTVFTDTALIGSPSQNVTVQGCATAAPTTCANQSFVIPATTITLNPATLSGPLSSGKTQAFSVNIANEGKATSLTWTLTPSPSSSPAGTLTSATTTITQSGSPMQGVSSNTYAAPNPITTAAAVTMNVCMTANPQICATPVVIQLPGFSLAAANNNRSETALSLGHSMSYTIAAGSLDGFSGPIALAVSGLPAGVAATFSSPTISTSGSVTLTLTAAYSSST